jgi:hypothetical protein
VPNFLLYLVEIVILPVCDPDGSRAVLGEETDGGGAHAGSSARDAEDAGTHVEGGRHGG